jgi:hypothetical protein
VIDYLHEKDEDTDDKNDVTMSTEERQYRERLRLTIGELKTSSSKEQDITDNMYWSTDNNLRKLLRYRPSIQDMELILRPMCTMITKRLFVYNDNSLEHRKYFVTLQLQLIEYFLEKYTMRSNDGGSRNRGR